MTEEYKYVLMKLKQIDEDIKFNRHWLEIYHINPMDYGVEIAETKQLIKWLEYDKNIYTSYKEKLDEDKRYES